MVFTPTLTNVMMTKAIKEYDRYSMKRLQAAMAVRASEYAQYCQVIAERIVLAVHKAQIMQMNCNSPDEGLAT